MIDEVAWKEIPGFSGRYSVSSDGRVWNNETGREVREWESPSRDGKPYFKVCLHHPGGVPRGRSSYYVHRLVASVFLKDEVNIPIDLHVHHGPDRDRKNNCLNNLKIIDFFSHLSAHASADADLDRAF